MSAPRRHVAGVIAAVALAVISAGAGCSNGSGSLGQSAEKTVTPDKRATPSYSATPNERGAKPATETAQELTLTVNNFGVFGYKPLDAESTQAQPNIEIVESAARPEQLATLLDVAADGGGLAMRCTSHINRSSSARPTVRSEKQWRTASRVSNRAARSPRRLSLSRSRMPGVPPAE